MPVNQKYSISKLQQKADNLKRAVLEFEEFVSKSDAETGFLRREVMKVIDQKKMHDLLNKIIDIKL